MKDVICFLFSAFGTAALIGAIAFVVTAITEKNVTLLLGATVCLGAAGVAGRLLLWIEDL